MSDSRARSATLLFSTELSGGEMEPGALDRRSVHRAVGRGRVPRLPTRFLDRLLVRLGRRGYERNCLAPSLAARRDVLGSRADRPPRFLVRVDEFPHARAFDETRFSTSAYEDFHSVLADAGVEYLLAALPRPSRNPYDPDASGGRELTPEELALLDRIGREGVGIGVHGLDHRTRHSHPSRHSELLGLSAGGLERRLDEADGILAQIGTGPRVFVPPFNRFSAEQYSILARRYDIVCGGPESVLELGFRLTPQWLGPAIYLPAYPPLYGRAAEIRPLAESMIQRGAGVWTPIVLHWGWELEDGFSALGELAKTIGDHSASWAAFWEEATVAAAMLNDPAGGGLPQ
jgi:hypothetical protein